jgi:RNA polymerase sigma-70 factor (ECF subfamily)
METSLIKWKPSVGELIPSQTEVSSGEGHASQQFSNVWSHVAPGLARTALALGIARDRVDDLLQEVWLAAWQDGPKELEEEGWRRWLYRVMVNRCRLEHRRKSRWARAWTMLISKPTSNVAMPDKTVEGQELHVKVETALAQLQPILREIVVLRYFSEFDSREISDMLGIPDSTVRSHLRTARQILATALADWDPKQ